MAISEIAITCESIWIVVVYFELEVSSESTTNWHTYMLWVRIGLKLENPLWDG